MSSTSYGRSLTSPRLQVNPDTQTTVTGHSPCQSPIEMATLSPLAPPTRPYTPASRTTHTRPTTSDSQTEFLDIPPRSRSYPGDSPKPSSSSGAASGNSQTYMLGRDGSGSRVPSRTGSSRSANESLNTKNVAQLFEIIPDKNLIVYPEEVEMDDEMHKPDPRENERDFRVFTKRGFLNIGGLAFVMLGVLTLFIAYPAITFVDPSIRGPPPNHCATDPMCISSKVPLLKNIRTGLIDPDTPESAMTIKSAEGDKWELVFSDEFNRDGRTFYPGDDPYFQAVDIWYGVTQDLEWYDPDAITTKDGALEIRFDEFENHGLNFRSGMLQSWNQLCFTGGRLEASISLPGSGDVSGLWPGFWSMGNLGRPGYAATTDGMWPYSYSDICDAGITPNQSSPDGISYLPGMRLPACSCKGEDHPTPGKSRSAPEIDVLEATVHVLNIEDPSVVVGDVSQSCQLAPFDVWYMPNYEFTEVYDPRITKINPYSGGTYQQSVSGLTNVNNDWYEGKEYQVYAYEYEPGPDGYITWFVGKDKTWKLDARALGPNGNVGQRVIPTEPLSIVLNVGMSGGFTPVDLSGLKPLFPATMRVDYLRIYQDPKKKSVTCDPPGMETTEYIRTHKEPYMNPNMTLWSQTGWDWPKNTFIHGCD